jgi:hypothetical protein
MKPFFLRILSSVAGVGMISAGVLAVPEGAGPPARPAAATSKASVRFEMQSRTGTLKTYRAGKSVVIAGPDGRLKRLPVDPAARVDRNLTRGQQVNVISMTDETGQERVSAISRSAPAASEAAAGSSAGSSPRPRR